MPKHKPDRDHDHSAKLSPPACIIHVHTLKDHGRFTPLSEVKGTAEDKLCHLQQIRDRRLSLPHNSPYRMQSACDQIPHELPNDLKNVGYHRQCYQRFVSNLNRLPDPHVQDEEEPEASGWHHSPRKSATTLQSAGPLFPPECIFCGKVEKKDGDRKTERAVLFPSWRNKENGWEQIEHRAEKMGLVQLHRQVKNKDLFAVEAKHHHSCFRSFRTAFANYERGIQRSEREDTEQARVSAAHEKAFVLVLAHIQEHVIRQNEVLKLTSLRSLYIEELKQNGFDGSNYRSEKLLKRLHNDPIMEHVQFTKLDQAGAISFWLVHSKNITVPDALVRAYTLGSTDQYQDIALLLRHNILQVFKESEDLPWPFTSDDMELSPEKLLPLDLIRFLSLLIAGKEDTETRTKTKRLVSSIGQDLCRAVTEGQWKLPKHVLICVTIRHLFRSRQLNLILNRLGHSETYEFGLELETAQAKALEEASTHLTPQILTGEGNSVFHCEWDNLNKTTTNVHGSSIVNSAGGIMLQEVKSGFEVTKARTMPTIDKSYQRTLKVDTPESLPPLHFNRVGPTFSQDTTFTHPAENDTVHVAAMRQYYVWLLSRYIGSSGKQPVPGLGGFTSATGTPPPRKSTVDYFTPIHQPITDNAVVRELLKRSEEATDQVGQTWVINTFDLGVCMKALPIIWKWPDEFARHVVMIGPFHTSMNYIGMITGHKMCGSGYTEILFEAQLVRSGSLKGILSGRAYAKALFCLKTVCEAMERLLIERFAEEQNISVADPAALLNMTQFCNRENLDGATNDPSTLTLIRKYQEYEERVSKGYLGKTATFWMSFITHCRLVFMLLHSVKTNNLELFHKCNGDMADIFFAFDGQNYARYLVWMSTYLTNIEKTHPGARDLLTKGAIAVARSLIPGALSAVDKTMEETFMRFAKSTGGFTGLYSKFGAYQKWCRTTSTRAQFYEKTLEMVGLIDDPDSPRSGRHRELEKAEIQKGEEAVQRVVAAVKNFTNPFTIADHERLYSIASGAPVSIDVEKDVLRAEEVGRTSKNEFVERLQKGEPGAFFDPIKRKKLKNMEACNKKVTLTSSKGKLIQYQEQSNLAFALLVKSQNQDEPLDLDELMTYSLLPIPPSLGTPDGFYTKTNKATILHHLLEDVNPEDVTYPKDALFIQDGMALFHVLSDLPPTCGDICLQILDQMVAKQHFLFSTDSYHPESIKAQERLRRGISEKIILAGPATRKPFDFKRFLANDDNKKQLCQLMLQVWSSRLAASRLEKTRMAVLIVEGTAHQFKTSDGEVQVSELPDLYSNQEETDTRVVLYLHHAASLGYKSAVVRTPDTDIFVILLYHAHAIKLTVYLDTGSGKHRQLINVSDLAESLGKDYCSTILGFYVFSGEDCTSAFKGKGKVGPMKKLEKSPRFHGAFRELGNNWNVQPQILKDLEEFTCLMYGQSRQSSVDVIRPRMLRRMVGEDEKLTLKSKVDLARLPPCHSALKPHLHRVNHRVALYKRADQPIIEKPNPYDAEQGWTRTNAGVLEPIWSYGAALPTSLVDLLEASEHDKEDEEEADREDEMDFDAFVDSDDD